MGGGCPGAGGDSPRRPILFRYHHGMSGVAAGPNSKSITILGHGLTVAESFELTPGIRISSEIPKLDVNVAAAGCRHFSDYAAALQGSEIATFVLHVSHDEGGEALVASYFPA
jgi:hypothetical protein